MRQPLDFNDYNDKGELKTPARLVLSLLYMSRHLIFLILAGVSQFVGARRGLSTDTYWLPQAWLVLADIPVFLFLLLVARKEKLPKGGWLRRLLYLGVPVTVLLGVSQLALILGLHHRFLLRFDPLWVIDSLLMALCVYYLAFNPKVKRFFQEYGEPWSRRY